jgi:hypothetical protein
MRPPVRPAVAEREPPPDRDVTEILLLLPTRQAAALEEAARRRGLTLTRMLRGLIQESLRDALEKTTRRVLAGSSGTDRDSHPPAIDAALPGAGYPPCRVVTRMYLDGPLGKGLARCK